jgi:hypothetical protein
MAIAAQRFKFLDNETNVPIHDFNRIFDNSVYNAPNVDGVFQEISGNLLSAISSNELISGFKNSLPSFKELDLSRLERVFTDILRQPHIENSLSSSLNTLNVDISNTSSAVDGLVRDLSSNYARLGATVCSPFRLLNSLIRNLQYSILGQIAYLLLRNRMVRLANGNCPILTNQSIPINLPQSDKLLKMATTPIDVLKYMENNNVRTFSQPNAHNSENIWTSSDTYTYIKFPVTTFKEKDILIVNKILLYRAIYYKYEREIDPATNPNIHVFDSTNVINLISSNQYQLAINEIKNSNATKADLRLLSQQIRSSFSTDPSALSIAADLDNGRILSYTQIEEKKYMYYLPRYFELMKEYVDNPTYITTIRKYASYVNTNMDQMSRDFYQHVIGLYSFYKSNRFTLNTRNVETIYTSMVKNAPSSLTQSEIDVLINPIPDERFNEELDYGMPTASDYLYAA